MRPVSIIGIGSTAFAKLEGKSVVDLATDACIGALGDAGVEPKKIQALYLGNFTSGILTGQEILAYAVANRLGLTGIPAGKTEGACASSSVAFRQATIAIASGMLDFALVVGVEKMTAATVAKVTAALASALDQSKEGKCGLTFPGIFAMMARRHMHEFGTTREQIAMVSVKNRKNGVKNPIAQFRSEVAMEKILSAKMITDPFVLYDCSPISDGAAAVVLCAGEIGRKVCRKPVSILACEQAVGYCSTDYMPDMVSFPATTMAVKRAYSAAGVSPRDIDFVELHDCFTIAEIIDSEDLGLFEKGKGGFALEKGVTQPEGQTPINASGGLLSKGHPVGATGIGQVFEVCRQLRDEHPNQLNRARIGLAHNLGGTGAVASVTVLRRGN
ncbi:MAG: thiolase domain-containing protein [Ignavibacteriales bacterium]